MNIKKKRNRAAFAAMFCLSYWTPILSLTPSLCCKSPRSLRLDRSIYYIGWVRVGSSKKCKVPPAVRGQQPSWVWLCHSWKVPIDYKVYELNSFFSNDLLPSSTIKQDIIWKPALRQNYRMLSEHLCIFKRSYNIWFAYCLVHFLKQVLRQKATMTSVSATEL